MFSTKKTLFFCMLWIAVAALIPSQFRDFAFGFVFGWGLCQLTVVHWMEKERRKLASQQISGVSLG